MIINTVKAFLNSEQGLIISFLTMILDLISKSYFIFKMANKSISFIKKIGDKTKAILYIFFILIIGLFIPVTFIFLSTNIWVQILAWFLLLSFFGLLLLIKSMNKAMKQ